MIDHVSIAVRDLGASGRFYETVLTALGHGKLVARSGTIGFGNERRAMTPVDADSGTHICFRARDAATVDAFHAAVLQAGGRSDGAPGLRPEYTAGYYAAFVRDPEGNRIEAVTFIAPRD
jgi:catechol 2,3-dioxygenase-like lactoylglutathione lyase family enzyme